MNSLMKMIGKDCEDIINNYVFELEYEDRVREHKITFDRCIEGILNVRMLKYTNMILDDLNYTIRYDTIEVEYIKEGGLDFVDIFYDLELNNMNNWTGFNGRELLFDILSGFSRFEDYEDKVEFISECFEMDGVEEEEEIDYEEDREKYSLWYDDMEKKFEFITDILGDNGILYNERNEFIDFIKMYM